MLHQSSFSFIKQRGIRYGAIAGIIATWSISTGIAASEAELGLPISTFYSIMGLSLGLDNFTTAAYVGFALHLLTGTLLGVAIGIISVRRMKIMMDPYRAILAGIIAGVVMWLVLFVPVTFLLVHPSITRIAPLLPQSVQGTILTKDINQFVTGVAMGAIVFHIVWGTIFGFISNSLMRISARRSIARHEDGKDSSYGGRAGK
jgi:hypothetical protein